MKYKCDHLDPSPPILQKLKKGSHSVQFNVAKAGVYTIGLIINGSAYKKTVTIK